MPEYLPIPLQQQQQFIPTDEKFLDFVSPKYAIISVGKNSFGHPSLRTIRKLERVGAIIWRTDEKNDIIIR